MQRKKEKKPKIDFNKFVNDGMFWTMDLNKNIAEIGFIRNGKIKVIKL